MVARLECDDGGESARVGNLGQRVDLGVRGSRSAVPALGDDRPIGIEKNAPDLRVFANARATRRELNRSTHRVVIRGGVHPDSFTEHESGDATRGRAVRELNRFPHRASSHPDFNRRSRNFTRSTEWSKPPGSRTLTAGSDFH